MEIPDIILEQAIAESNSSSVHSELDSLLKKLQNKTIEQIIYNKEDEEIWSINNDIYNLINETIYRQKSENDKIDDTAQIVFSAKEYLHKGVSTGDIKAILIFLSINCYLQIDLKKIFTEIELESDYTKAISEEILKVLKSINLSIHLLPNAPNWEKEIKNDYHKGFSESDISITYRFIESIERGGRGFHFNFLLERLLSFLFHLNYTYFLKALLKLKDPTEIVFYFQSFKKEDILKIANESSLSNKWLNFELIRQIIEKENKETIDEFEIATVKNVLDRVKLDDFNFLKQTAIYFHRSQIFNASLGIVLSSVHNEQIEEVISDFSIDRYVTYIKHRDLLLTYFLKTASEDQHQLILNLIYNKWNSYIDKLLKSEDSYCNGIVLTDFANYVVHYHKCKTDDNDLISLIQNLIDKIEFIDSEWLTSRTQQQMKLHLYHSELYILSYVYKYKMLNYPHMLEKYERIITNRVQLSRYVEDETKGYFEIGKQNIDHTRET